MPFRVLSVDFNSIKVQLKPLRACCLPRCVTFQFHKGTIKTQTSQSLTSHSTNFNSIKVQLKHGAENIRDHTPQFQFHKGTIKTTIATAYQDKSYISIP